MTTIYKICPIDLWEDAKRKGVFTGAPVDIADGYIHFSTAQQARETAAKHFAGQSNLMLLWIDSEALGGRLKWEVSRGGALFPHLYETLDLKHVTRAEPLRLGADGKHLFPDLS